jgi:ubiquinone/menaquinone biosynthesis C-methylase UbiE
VRSHEESATPGGRSPGSSGKDMNSIDSNLHWWSEEYAWPQDGDEWTELAEYSGLPYAVWCQSVVEVLIRPFLRPGDTALEIGPGRGRWLGHLSSMSNQVIAVDISPSCIEYCSRRYVDRDNIRYIVNDGRWLSGVESDSIHFAFSLEAFVHMDVNVINDYLSELARVLMPGGIAVIHHAGRAHRVLWLRWLRHGAKWRKGMYTMLSLRRVPNSKDGWRSDVSRRDIVRLSTLSGLAVVAQVQRWGPGLSADVRRGQAAGLRVTV